MSEHGSIYISKGGEIVFFPDKQPLQDTVQDEVPLVVRPSKDAERDVKDSVVDAVVRGFAEFHIAPLLEAFDKRANPTISEIVNRNINGYYEEVLYNELGQ